MDKGDDMKKWISVPILSIVIGYIGVGELLMFYGMVLPSIVMYTTSILIVIFLMIFGELSLGMKNILQSLILLSLLRIINTSMPQFFEDIHLQYLLIYGVMIIPIYLAIKNQLLSYKELGKNFRSTHTYLPAIVLIVIIAIMVGQYMNDISYAHTAKLGDMPIYGELMTILLIILLLISLLIMDTEYWNRYISNALGACYSSLLLAFVIIVVFRIKLVI